MQQKHALRLSRGVLAAMSPDARKAHLKEQAERYYNQRYKRRFPKDEGDHKQCRKCLETKPKTPEFFTKNAKLKNGFTSWCRKCLNKRSRDTRIRTSYLMTREEYDALFVGASCAICHVSERLVMDHCHDRGTPRGVLCAECNTGLGMFKDDPAIIDAAAEYLRESRR